MIRGQDLTIHTEHLKLLYNKLPSQRMTRWRLLLEEYHPKVVHIADVDNNIGDAIFRLDITNKANGARVWGFVAYSPGTGSRDLAGEFPDFPKTREFPGNSPFLFPVPGELPGQFLSGIPVLYPVPREFPIIFSISPYILVDTVIFQIFG